MKLFRLIALLCVLLLAACASTPEGEVLFPDETLVVSGRSSLEFSYEDPQSGEEIALATLPIPSYNGVLTPVRVTAEADLRSAVLDPRLASLLAHEEARLRVMTDAAHHLQATGQQWENAEDLLVTHTVVEEDALSAQAKTTWTGVSPVAQLGSDAAAVIDTRPLTRQERRQMEEQARQQAVNNLRALLLENEMMEGMPLVTWLEEKGITDEALMRTLNRARITKRDHWEDNNLQLHVCEIEIEFDQSRLNSLQ